MVATLYDLARMTTPTTGTGVVALGVAVPGFLSFVGAGVPDGAVVSYAISDGGNSEIGRGTYSAGAQTLTRTTPIASTSGGASINLSGSAQIAISPLARDILLTSQTLTRSDAGAVPVPVPQILQRCPRVQDFGPVGTADDSLAWNGFIAALQNGRYEGVLDGNTTVTIGPQYGGATFNSIFGCTISGEGESSIIRVGAGLTGLRVGGSNGIKLRDLRFQGANNTTAQLLNISRSIASATTFYNLDNVWFDGGFNQLFVGDAVYEGMIQNCKFLNSGNYAARIAPVNQNFANMQNFLGCRFVGYQLGLYATNFADLTVENCQFERDSVIASPGYSIYADIMDGLFISGCYFEDFNNIQEIATGANMRSVSIRDNYFTLNQGVGVLTNIGAYVALANALRVSVRDNTFTSYGTIGRILDFANSTYVSCRDNFFNPNICAIGIACGLGVTIDVGNNSPGTGTYTTTFSQAPPNVRKAVAWGSYNSSTSTLINSHNVSGVVKNSTGNFTVSFATPLIDANYAVALSCVVAGVVAVPRPLTKNIANLVIDIVNTSLVEVDGIVDFVVFGDMVS